MIFVVAGIIILIVSFVIALASLMRERARPEEAIGNAADEAQPTLSKQSELSAVSPNHRVKLGESQARPDQSPKPQTFESSDLSIEASDWQKFPWDRQSPLPQSPAEDDRGPVKGEISVAKLISSKDD